MQRPANVGHPILNGWYFPTGTFVLHTFHKALLHHILKGCTEIEVKHFSQHALVLHRMLIAVRALAVTAQLRRRHSCDLYTLLHVPFKGLPLGTV